MKPAIVRVAVVAGWTLVFLLLQIVPTSFVLQLFGLWFVASLIVDDAPRAWRAIRRR